MESSLRQVALNRETTAAMQEAGAKVYPCTEILGSMEPIKDFALFHYNHKADLEVIEASNLLDFANTQTFTPGEFKMYRMGLETMRKFFEASEADYKSYSLDAQKGN